MERARNSVLLSILAVALAPAAFCQTAGSAGDRTPVILGDSGGSWLDRLRSAYLPKHVRAVSFRNSNRIYDLIRAGNLYLSLPDAIALAIENNLNVEVARFNVPEAKSDVLRAQGGGTLRGIALTTTELPQGVGGPVSPLLNGAATGTTPSTAVPTNVTELASLLTSQTSLSIVPNTYSAGPPIPQFDPALVGSLQWQHQTTPETSTFITGTNTLITNETTGSLTLQQGLSWGTQYSLGYNSTSQNINSTRSNYNPYTNGSLGLNVTQPLLRGFGAAVNRRFIHIARNNEKISTLIFRQQLLNVVYGVSRLYDDLVALNEDLKVKRDTLTSARTLYENNKAGVEEGTLAPVELTRAEAQVAGAEQDLVNSQGLLDEQEVIVKDVLTRGGSRDPAIRPAHIIPTETLEIPEQEPVILTDELLQQAFANRPDILQAGLQIENSKISLKGSRNELLPELDLVGIAQNSALSGQANSLQSTGSTASGGAVGGTGVTGTVSTPDTSMIGGYGTALSQIFSRKYPTYGLGIQLNLPLRNRIAQADVERDELQYRQVQALQQQLRNQAELEVNDAMIGLRRARAAYDAAVKTRILQAQSLEVELVRFQAGVDTAFFVIQYQSYLSQARSTEVVARGNYFKARAALTRAVGTSLEDSGISFDEAYRGVLSRGPARLPELAPPAAARP